MEILAKTENCSRREEDERLVAPPHRFHVGIYRFPSQTPTFIAAIFEHMVKIRITADRVHTSWPLARRSSWPTILSPTSHFEIMARHTLLTRKLEARTATSNGDEAHWAAPVFRNQLLHSFHPNTAEGPAASTAYETSWSALH